MSNLKRKRGRTPRNVQFETDQREIKKRGLKKTIEVNRDLKQKMEKNMRSRCPSSTGLRAQTPYSQMKVAHAAFKPRYNPASTQPRGPIQPKEMPMIWTRADMEHFMQRAVESDQQNVEK